MIQLSMIKRADNIVYPMLAKRLGGNAGVAQW